MESSKRNVTSYDVVIEVVMDFRFYTINFNNQIELGLNTVTIYFRKLKLFIVITFLNDI